MNKKRAKLTGKGTLGSYVALPHAVLNSSNFLRMSAHGVKLVLDLYSQYYGHNNGDFSMSWTRMRRRGWRSRETLEAARDEALHYGWIVLTRQGGRNRCSLYAVTWQEIDECKGKLDVRPTKAPLGTWRTEVEPWDRQAWQEKRRRKSQRKKLTRLARLACQPNPLTVSVSASPCQERSH
jgi:hypothetical protein